MSDMLTDELLERLERTDDALEPVDLVDLLGLQVNSSRM
jgi:hypothetical protein